MKRNARKMSERTAQRMRNARGAYNFARQTIRKLPAAVEPPELFDVLADAFRVVVAELSIADRFISA